MDRGASQSSLANQGKHDTSQNSTTQGNRSREPLDEEKQEIEDLDLVDADELETAEEGHGGGSQAIPLMEKKDTMKNTEAEGLERLRTMKAETEQEVKDADNLFEKKLITRMGSLSNHSEKRERLVRPSTATKKLLKAQDPAEGMFQEDTALNVPNYDKYYEDIDNAKEVAEDQKFEDYSAIFNEEAGDEVMVIGNLDTVALAEQERKIQEDNFKRSKKEELEYELRQNEIVRQEELAKQKLFHYAKQGQIKLIKEERYHQNKFDERQRAMQKAFDRAEQRLMKVMGRRVREVRTNQGFKKGIRKSNFFGQETRGLPSIPQPIGLRLEMCRSPKDKIPSGQYVLLVQLWDRMGGNVIHYRPGIFDNRDDVWKQITRPRRHGGRHYNNELRIEQSIYIIAPPKQDLRPSMAISFELFQLRNRRVKHDQTIAWGMFPLIDFSFDYNVGRFKIPMLRGDIDMNKDKYGDIEKLYKSNVDEWVCNLYFEIYKLRVDKISQRNQMRIQNSLQCDYPSHTLDDNRDENFDYSELELEDIFDLESTEENPLEEVIAIKSAKEEDDSGSSLRRRNVENVEDEDRPLIGGAGKSDTVKSYDKDDSKVVQRKKTKAKDEDEDRFLVRIPKRNFNRVTDGDQFEEFSFAIARQTGLSTAHSTYHKVKYLFEEVFTDLGFQQMLSANFWITIVLFILTLWIVIYGHYLGQYFWLYVFNVPISTFKSEWYRFELEYSRTAVRNDIVAIIAGPASCELFFCFLWLVTWAFQRLLGDFPKLGSKFVATLGILTVFDFLIILIADCLARDWTNGDAFKLYDFFDRKEGNGSVGIILTIIIYSGLVIIFASLLYVYLLLHHMNGRLLDIYNRLAGSITTFFIPDDMEISHRYLKWVCHKSKKFKGANEERRLIEIKDYILKDHRYADFNEISTHVLIYNVDCDENKTLYRHFMRYPNGSIVELNRFIDAQIPESRLLHQKLEQAGDQGMTELQANPENDQEEELLKKEYAEFHESEDLEER